MSSHAAAEASQGDEYEVLTLIRVLLCRFWCLLNFKWIYSACFL